MLTALAMASANVEVARVLVCVCVARGGGEGGIGGMSWTLNVLVDSFRMKFD